MAFAVVETTDDEVILNRTAEILMAMNEDKEVKGVSCSFLAVVNIVALKSTLLLLGPNERSLAVAAFPQCDLVLSEEAHVEPFRMDLGGLVSRKKDFVPAVSAAVKKGWSDAPVGRIHSSKSDVFDLSKWHDA